MKVSILCVLPDFLQPLLKQGLIAKAVDQKLLEIEIVALRDFADPPHFRVDDRPYGGGAGMILKPEPIARALQSIDPEWKAHRVLLSAKGELFDQQKAQAYSELEHLILICGRYEGVDERIARHFVNQELRIGDYVLMGGEFAAAVVVEASLRLCPGVLGNPSSLAEESFAMVAEAEYPQYTRPRVFEGQEVPEVLMSGNHSEVKQWREQNQTQLISVKPRTSSSV